MTLPTDRWERETYYLKGGSMTPPKLGPQEPPNDPRIFNRRQPDGTFKPMSEFFEPDKQGDTMNKITEAQAEELAAGMPSQKMYATKRKEGGFKAASSKHLMGYDTEIAAIPWVDLQAWHTEIAHLRQDKAELLNALREMIAEAEEYSQVANPPVSNRVRGAVTRAKAIYIDALANARKES